MLFPNFELSGTAAGSGNFICLLLSSSVGIEDNQIQTGAFAPNHPSFRIKSQVAQPKQNVVCARNSHCEMWLVFTGRCYKVTEMS